MLLIVSGTGYLNFEEFCDIIRKKMQEDEDERELREMFRSLDKERRGEVNTSELRSDRFYSKPSRKMNFIIQ